MTLPEGCVVLRACEVVQVLMPDGNEVAFARWQGTPNVIAELGMVDYAKAEVIIARFALKEDLERDDDPGGSGAPYHGG